jgi:hypothetical protein
MFHALLNSTELILEAVEDVFAYGICCHPLLPNNDADYLSMLLLVAWLDFLSLQATRASDFSRDCFHHLNPIPLEVCLRTGRTVVILIICFHLVPKRVLLSFQCVHVAVFSELPVWLLYF